MLFKVLSLLAAFGMLAFFLNRWIRGEAANGGGAAMRAGAHDFRPCEICGAYKSGSALCDCETRPLP